MVNPRHFDLQSLRVFALVAEHGSLTKAAEHGQLTPSAVSKRIAELESVTGSALFVRHARSAARGREPRRCVGDAHAVGGGEGGECADNRYREAVRFHVGAVRWG